MFGKSIKESVRKATLEALRDSDVLKLKEEIYKLKDELEELKITKKIELRDIEHMVKVKEEKQTIELERKTIELERKYQEKEMELLRKGHEKVMELLESGKKDLQEIYGKIIERLPNVTMKITEDRK